MPALSGGPARLPAGRVSRQPGIPVDLTATVLTACGVELPKGRTLDGINLLPLLIGDRTRERTFFWRIERKDRQQKAVRQGIWKYVRDGGIELLFDLSADPGERKDLGYRRPEKVAELRKLLAGWEKEMAAERPMFQVK